jgi:hypothetical protein
MSQQAKTVARGYGAAHKALRKRWAPQVAAGHVACARCGRWISPHEPWDLGHIDGSRTQYAGPEHRKCNRATQLHGVKQRSRRRTRRLVAIVGDNSVVYGTQTSRQC